MEMYIPKSFRQILALVLCMAMILPILPVSAYATEAEENGPVVSTEVPTEEPTEAPAEEPTEAPTEALVLVSDARTFYDGPVIQVSDNISIPAYSGGTTSKSMVYDCGNGVTGKGEKSYLTIVTGTTSAQFTAYTELLANNGYELKMEKEITSDDAADPNRFASFTSPDGKYKLYTYHFPFYQETRIILDTQADTVAGFSYTAQGGTEVKPMLAMYGLSMADNGYDTQLSTTDYTQGRRNCGALVVIRMPDNSLFIHDGGDIQQWSDNACDEFLAFCRELTGTTGTNEKMVINTWFLSHAHSDHFLGFPRFIRKYHDQFDLKNIMYNIDIERTYTTRDIYAVMQLVGGFYPNVKYYKPHTGESFEIAGVQFDVMYAHEDRYLPDAEGNLITDYPEIENGQTTTEYDLGGTYRGYCYDTANDANTQSDFNDTSTVLRITFDNGVSSILYADMNRVEQTLFDIYPDDALKGDIVMVPHHGFDSHPKLMAMSGATIFLYTQHKQAIYGPDGDYTTEESDKSVYRPRLLNNFIPMKDAIDKTGAVEGTDYKFYWAGNETAVIDINSMTEESNGTANEMSGMELDKAAAANMDITVYTSEANDDIYSNAWTIYDLDDGTEAVSTSDEKLFGSYGSTSLSNIATGVTQHIRFDLVTKLTVNKRYVIRSVAYPQYVMSYAPVAENPGKPNMATSLIENEDPDNSTATNFFFTKDDYLYLDHSNRDNTLWILKQGDVANNTVLTSGGSYTSFFDGTACYCSTRLFKGIGPTDEYNADGTFKDTNNGAYWYSIQGNDTTDPITQYRFMQQRYVTQWMYNYEITSDSHEAKYIIESFGDGTYLIYWRSKDGDDFRFLTCDANGSWSVVRYTDATGDEYPAVSEAKKAATLKTLKVQMYEYNFPSETNMKAVQFSGDTVFNLKQGTTYEEILAYIQQTIVVRDQDRRHFGIPGNGDTAKVGYYWLDFDKTFDASKADTYTITVKYRNDNGTDTKITDLTLNITELNVAGTTSYTVMEGTSQAEVEAMIKNAITVTKTLGSEQSTVSYSSAPAKGYYWLDFNVPFDSVNGSSLYTVSVKYRNSDGSDVVAEPLTVQVQVLPLNLAVTGTTKYVVEEGVTEEAVRQMIVQGAPKGITVTRNTISGGTENVPYNAAATVGSYWLEFDSVFNSAADGDHDYFVKVWYRNGNGTDTLVETLAVYVEQEITEWTVPVDKVGTVPLNASLTTIAQMVEGEESHNITFTVNGETRYVTVGLLTDANKKPVDTSKAGTYENLILTYMGKEICKDFTLIVTASNDALDYPQKGQGGYVGVDKQSTTNTDEFQESGKAQIQLSATGTPPEQGIDLIIIMDLSGSMKNEMGTNVDAEDYENSRAVAMENALKDMIQMLAESGQDVTIAMSDFGDLDHNVFKDSVADESILHEAVFDINNDNGRYLSSSNENKQYEFTNQLNYVFRSGEATALDANGNAVSKIGTFANVHTKFNMAHPEYTGVIVPNVYTGTGEVEAGAFVKVSDLYNGGFTSTMNSIIAEIDENVHKALGTNYDIGLEYAYQLAYAKQQENIANGQGKERDIVVIFMSDGAAMQYNYFAGRPDSQSWSDYLLGTFDSIGSADFSEENQDILEKISKKMLEKLTAGTLTRWEYHRDAPAPELYAKVDDAEPFDASYDESEYFLYRMRSDKGRDSSTSSFYGYMEDLGFDLDWEYLCAIARANGIEDFDLEYYQSHPRLPELINKLLVKDTLLGYEKVETKDDNGQEVVTWYEVYQTDLVNPGLDEIQYYPKFTGTHVGDTATDQFLNAMASIGVDCTWEIYGKIAFKNRNTNIEGGAYEIEHALKDLAAALKNVGNDEPVTYSPYSYFYNADGKNWWAEAIKGETDQLYPVINKYAFEDSTDRHFTYYGDVRNNYDTETGLALDGKDYIAGFRGLDVDMYTISFSICNDVFLTVDTAEKVLKNIASGPTYFFSANTEDELTECMKAIVSSMSNAATRAWFTDTLGAHYDLYVGQPNPTYIKGETVSTIVFQEYDVNKDGDRIGDPSNRETITLADMDGDGDIDAWSNRMFSTNVDDKGNVTYEYYDIWDEDTDLITGKYVIYNASKTKTTRLTLDDSGLTYPLAPETFFWTIGMIGEFEVVLEYEVYLTGSREGELVIPAGEIGVYDTNKEAILHYINYLGNNCTLDTVPPAFPWGNPAVGYVFYLVDENGNPLDNQGRITDFAHSLKLSTAVYENLNTGVGNNTTTINASEKLAATDLAKGYQLYDPTASYTVVYDTAWQNNGGNTTYVTQYGSTVPSNAANSAAAGMNSETLDLEKTVVYFALMVKQPDAGMQVGKSVEATTDANKFILTLDAYATGHEIIRPADIVLVLDHSGSMRTPVGAPAVLESETLYTGAGSMSYTELDETLGQHTGYYVAQSQSSKTWFVVRYDAAETKWYIYSVPTTESIVNIQYASAEEAEKENGWTEHTKTQSWTVQDIEAKTQEAQAFINLKFYKSQYAALYDAVQDFVSDLKATGAEHRVAIIGFAASAGQGTRVYIGGSAGAYKSYNAMYHANTDDSERAALYQLALKNIQTPNDYAQLLSSIEAIETNYSYTCPSAGLKMASDLLASNAANTEERDRIVVLFTDGIPNAVIGESTGTTLTDAKVLQIRNEIVGKAYEAKIQGAQIYAISTTTLGAGADRTFLSYVSSDYPNATSYTAPGTAISAKKYTKEISSADALQNVFADISESTTVSAAKIDETAVLKEVLSDYVQLDEKATVECEVFTQDYLGNGKWGDLKAFTTAKVDTSPATGRVETIEVSGFDYADNYVSEKAHTDPSSSSNTNFLGRRLVLKVYIESRTGFWGGNNVPTNKSSTAVYSEGKVVKPFPQPEVNVPITVDVKATDKTIYYDGDVTGKELIESVTVGGVDVTVNDDGTFTPAEDWMNDYADLSWTKDSTKPDSEPDNHTPDDYTFEVQAEPKYDGSENRQENPGNIAGNIDGGTVEDTPSAETTKTDKDTGHVYILVPELTFKDSTTEFGTLAEGYDFNKNDFVSTETVTWVNMETNLPESTVVPEVSGEEPTLKLTYTPDTEGDHSLEDGTFVTDTKVNVTVAIDRPSGEDPDITDVTSFKWDDCEHNVDNIAPHKGNADSHEFWVHVTLSLVPDTVVIDYGLDVVIDVLANDPRYGDIVPVLTGIGAKDATSFDTAAVPGEFGQLTIDSGKVRYALNTSNGMQINKEEVFTYQATYTVKDKTTALSETVTVIPATIIYYEDEFVQYSVWSTAAPNFPQITDPAQQWAPVPEQTVTMPDQGQDRPGEEGTTENNTPVISGAIDADNIYGYDGRYTNMATYSMGSAMKVTVNSDKFAEAQFSFSGTGFDIISLTSGTTGTILVDIYKTSDFKKPDGDDYTATIQKSLMVDTYYGYQYTLCNVSYLYTVDDNGNLFWERSVDSVATGATAEAPAEKTENPVRGDSVTGIEYAWIVDKTASDTLYQVPVMKVTGLEYGEYTALITVSYKSALDHKEAGSYDFYLDAIRIYDPANDGKNSATVKDAYVADGEGWPEYFELRNLIIKKDDFNSLADGTGSGIVFIDNTVDIKKEDGKYTTSYSIEDYTNYGPNNELYLAPGQSVAFKLEVPDPSNACKVAGIHLAMKSVSGTANVKVYDAADSNQTSVTPTTIATATDLYYDITSLNNKTVVITNTDETGDVILSITNVKVTYTSQHTDGIEQSYFQITQRDAEVAVASLMMMRAPVEPDVPETTEPETTEPETTEPETTEPETTEPETTEPETTEPEVTEPETTEPEVTEPEATEPEVFEPSRFSVVVSDSTPSRGSTVMVTVTTSADVDHITVNGKTITRYSASWFSKTRTWSTWITAENAGEMEVTVICYNAADTASEAVTRILTVSEKSLLDKIRDLLGGWWKP